MTTNQRDWAEERADELVESWYGDRVSAAWKKSLIGIIAAALREADKNAREEQKKIDAEIVQSCGFEDEAPANEASLLTKNEGAANEALHQATVAILFQRDDTKERT